ncbi:hypothetical protein ZWY2020_016054 [Hordeum vulgare]|nr:hypothetical protein ZWY2020_016054 [Hordeum vulgare]
MAQITISAVAIAAAALILVPVFTFTRGSVAAAGDPSPVLPPMGMPGCVTSCGEVEVPYPFGIGADASCYLPGFNLTCENTAGSSPRLLLDADGTIQVLLYISPRAQSSLDVQYNGDVKVDVDAHGNGNGTFSRGLRSDGPYSLSTMKNIHSELILTGCNVQATVKSGNDTVASCTSLCGDKADRDPYATDDESSVAQPCSGGTGCCRADIVTVDGYDDKDGEVLYNSSSTGTSKYTVQLRWFGRNRSADLERFPVRVFVADNRWFDDSSIYNDLLQTGQPPSEETMKVPLSLSWEVVGPPSGSVCKSNHSERIKGKRRGGYMCQCSQGYYGNPYLTNGCQDINECQDSRPATNCYGECINKEGSFTCRCPPGTTGNHSVPGGCVVAAVTGSCRRLCGGVEVPYPFGFGPSNCYRPGFGLVCETNLDSPRLFLGNSEFRVVNISLTNTTMRIIHIDNLLSYSLSLFSPDENIPVRGKFPFRFPGETPYSLSTSNELILTGCNTQATLLGHGNPAIISGCASFCSHNDTNIWGRWPTGRVHGGNGGKSCYGMSCCQARISESMDGMPSDFLFERFDNNTPESQIDFPGYVFIAEEGWFDQTRVTSKLMRESRRQQQDSKATVHMEVPFILHWEVLYNESSANVRSHRDCSSEVAGDLCRSQFSHCKPGNRGYTCQCNEDNHGNPYIIDGCKGGRRGKSFKGTLIKSRAHASLKTKTKDKSRASDMGERIKAQ